MNQSNVAVLNDRLLQMPESERELIAGYIADHLEEFVDDIQWSEDPAFLSDNLRAELERREAEALADPGKGVSWDELEDRLLSSR